MTLKFISTASLLDAQHNKDSVENKPIRLIVVRLCRWERHLAEFPHVGVKERWPTTPKRARYSALIAFS